MSLLSVSEHELPNEHLPAFMSSMTASCITSVYIVKGGISLLSPSPKRTALATFPTPDWRGRNVLGIRPAWISERRNEQTLAPIWRVVLSRAVKPVMPS